MFSPATDQDPEDKFLTPIDINRLSGNFNEHPSKFHSTFSKSIYNNNLRNFEQNLNMKNIQNQFQNLCRISSLFQNNANGLKSAKANDNIIDVKDTEDTENTPNISLINNANHIENNNVCDYVYLPIDNSLNDKYYVVKKICSGTFGDIFEIVDDKNNHFAGKAIKKSKYILNGTFYQQNYVKYSKDIINEGKLLLDLQKLYGSTYNMREIIKVRTICARSAIHIDDISSPLLVLDLMEISLLQYTKTRNIKKLPISLSTVRYISVQIFSALNLLHGIAGIIHADLKPHNILLNISGNHLFPKLKICDFGNALKCGSRIINFSIQSYAYRAPEALFGNQISTKIDMWSTGAIIMELIYKVNKYNTEYNNNLNLRSKSNALFNCDRNKLSNKIIDILNNKYPIYYYNQYQSYLHYEVLRNSVNKNIFDHQSNYLELKRMRKNRLVDSLNVDTNKLKLLSNDTQFKNLIDLIASLLDINPMTRYSSLHAIDHPFITNDVKYFHVENQKILSIIQQQDKLSTTNYKNIDGGNINRQNTINKQISNYQHL